MAKKAGRPKSTEKLTPVQKRSKVAAQRARQRFNRVYEPLPDDADPEEEVRWVRIHPKMMEAATEENPNLELTYKDIKDAPSKSAVVSLMHWLKNPAQFHKDMLANQRKMMENWEDNDKRDKYPEINDIDELLMSLSDAVRPDGTVEIRIGGVEDSMTHESD